MRYTFVILLLTVSLLIGCKGNIEQTPEYKARQVAAIKALDWALDAQPEVREIKQLTDIIEEKDEYYLIKVCDTNIECSCKEAYFIVNVSKADFSSNFIEYKACLYG